MYLIVEPRMTKISLKDELIAKAVPDIDLIISGHTHSQLDEPIQHGNTYIVSCGEYGRNLGFAFADTERRWADGI